MLDLPDIEKLRSLRCELAGEQATDPDEPGFGEAWGAWTAAGTCPNPAER